MAHIRRKGLADNTIVGSLCIGRDMFVACFDLFVDSPYVATEWFKVLSISRCCSRNSTLFLFDVLGQYSREKPVANLVCRVVGDDIVGVCEVLYRDRDTISNEGQ